SDLGELYEQRRHNQADGVNSFAVWPSAQCPPARTPFNCRLVRVHACRTDQRPVSRAYKKPVSKACGQPSSRTGLCRKFCLQKPPCTKRRENHVNARVRAGGNWAEGHIAKEFPPYAWL